MEEIKTRHLSRKQQEDYLRKGYHIEILSLDDVRREQKSEKSIAIDRVNKYRESGRLAFVNESGTMVRGYHSFSVWVK